MFKNLVGRNSIFASMGQQDAEEFFDHLCTHIERSEKGRVDPTRAFELALEQRIQCSTCSGVQYQNQQQKSLSVTIPFEQATPPLERIAGEKAEDRARREMNSVVTWNQLVESFSAPEQIDFTCERCKKRTHAVKTNRIAQFPEVLVLQARRQVFDEWLPRKVAVKLDVPQQIDLEQLRARGIQQGEQSLDAPAAPVQLRGIDEIVGMGFTKNAAIRAITETGNNGAETAMQWLFAHLEDSNINDPLPSTGSSGASKPQVPPELVAIIVEMGFNEAQARYALGKSANNTEAALELLFTTEGVIPDEPTPGEPSAPSAPVQRSSRYELVGFIVHLGFSLGSGHYIAFAKEHDGTWVKFNDNKVAESPVPPIDQGYMFFFANTGN
jgi:ubiquitin carboxyl-terminal hydrolase 5/13